MWYKPVLAFHNTILFGGLSLSQSILLPEKLGHQLVMGVHLLAIQASRVLRFDKVASSGAVSCTNLYNTHL